MTLNQWYEKNGSGGFVRLSALSGLSVSAIQRIFYGKASPRPKTKDLLTKVAGITDFSKPAKFKFFLGETVRSEFSTKKRVISEKELPSGEAWAAHLEKAKSIEFKPLQPRAMPLGYQPYHQFGKGLK